MSKLSKEHRRILATFRKHTTLTDSELEDIAVKENWPKAGEQNYYRRRRSDLKSRGLLTTTGQRRINRRGNSEQVWTLTTQAAINNGKNVFQKIRTGKWMIAGKALKIGQQATVITKDGKEKQVIITRIVTQNNNWQIAEFTWPKQVPARNVFIKNPAGQDYLIQGTNLTPGKSATVTTKNGAQKRVIIGEILTETETYQQATFTWPVNRMP
ncbi:hypothetical protein [Trueperella pyogenes]|uniref:hypothetical protein n=1 Tax=Trueperella pyogenes TaxID=1661 RepID=UPI00345DE51E